MLGRSSGPAPAGPNRGRRAPQHLHRPTACAVARPSPRRSHDRPRHHDRDRRLRRPGGPGVELAGSDERGQAPRAARAPDAGPGRRPGHRGTDATTARATTPCGHRARRQHRETHRHLGRDARHRRHRHRQRHRHGATRAAPAARPGVRLPTVARPTTPRPRRSRTPRRTIVGDAGPATPRAKPTGFDEDGSFRFVGRSTASPVRDAREGRLSEPGRGARGQRVTVTVTGTPTDVRRPHDERDLETITRPRWFVDESGEPIVEGADVDDPQYLDATAGERFSYTFHADGFPAPSYRLDGTGTTRTATEPSSRRRTQRRRTRTANAQRNASSGRFGWQAETGDDEESGPRSSCRRASPSTRRPVS